MILSPFGLKFAPTRSDLNHLLAIGFLLAASAVSASAATLAVSDLDWSKAQQDWGNPGINKSVDGHPLEIAGKTFPSGVGSHANSRIMIDLKKSAQLFTASVGVDDEPKIGAPVVKFRIIGDGKLLWESGELKGGEPAKEVRVPLKGVHFLTLSISSAIADISGAHGDWAAAEIQYNGAKPETIEPPVEKAVILTPKPGPQPRINGPSISGVHPGSPFLYRIPATGTRPMKFSAKNLPKGLTLDAETGIITGSVAMKGTYDVTLEASNTAGSASRKFKIAVGDTLALTPPMGWNSWNCWGPAVTQEKVLSSAKAMINSGLADHGYIYINTDDYWSVNPTSPDPTLHGPERSPEGNILTNPRFPDIKGMVDSIHSLGLRAGIYSSPGPWTCGNCVASYQHEMQDATQIAAWGFDYLKYDLCSYSGVVHATTRPEFMKPYQIMGDALAKQKRDIVYSLCQYGIGDVWEWGASLGGNSWRTTGDIVDTWSSMTGIGFHQKAAAPFAGPGHWNDPDMLIVGRVGWGANLHPTRLTPNEQYTHVSLWCLLSAPLLIGCDLSQIDEFTLSLLSNDEVLAIDQDELGKEAVQVGGTAEMPIYAKPLKDGSLAVGLFNLSDLATSVSVNWKTLGVNGSQIVRDLWRQKDLGVFKDHFEATVPSHGVVLVRIIPK